MLKTVLSSLAWRGMSWNGDTILPSAFPENSKIVLFKTFNALKIQKIKQDFLSFIRRYISTLIQYVNISINKIFFLALGMEYNIWNEYLYCMRNSVFYKFNGVDLTMKKCILYTRPPLSKKSFPVGRVRKKTANFNFFKLECIGGKVKKKIFWKDEKKSSSRPFLAHPAGGQETILYLSMALHKHEHDEATSPGNRQAYCSIINASCCLFRILTISSARY